MIKNYIKIAFRNLWKHKVFSLINIMGLAVGITGCFLIYLYVHFETSYDSFNTKADRIYRVVTNIKTPSDLLQWSSTPAPVAINMQRDFPEVESAVRISAQSFLVKKGNEKFQEKNTIMADSTLFKIFDFPLIYGDKNTALKEPMSVVLSQTTAKKYFGNVNPVGQNVLLTGDALNATITGVMKDIPENSQIKADMIVSMSSQKDIYKQSLDSQWEEFNLTTYLLLRPGANPKKLAAKFPAFIELHAGKGLNAAQMSYTFFLEPLRSVYLYSTRDGSKTGNINNVYIFSIIATFILLIACINFINLTTARSAERAREVGIRKVSGAGRFQLAKQFIGESMVISFMSFIVAVLLCSILLPLFNQLAGKQVSTAFFTHPFYTISLFLMALGLGIIAGLYPAIVLSSFQPVEVLKGNFATGSRGILLRKGLVIFQFTISIILIIGTVIVYTQLHFMRKQDLGFNKDHTIVIDTNGDKNKDAFNQSLASVPGVLSTSFSSGVPGDGVNTAYSKVENKAGEMQTTNLDVYFVDFNYITQYKMKIVAGRGFSKDFGTDTTQAMVINETAAKMLGYSSPEQAIGKNFDQWGRKGKIIGVIKDFHYQALQEPIKGLSLRIEPGPYQMLSIKVSANNLPSTIKAIQAKWNQVIPNRPFDYTFLDESFDKQYRADERFGSLFFNFALLAIFISCLGLLGLSSYSTIQRTKEIGVRKVLGAIVSNIVNLLSIDFLKLVLTAFIIAVPVAWFFMNKWLTDFAYRTALSWWMFVFAGIAAVIIAFVTISFQAIKAAVANP
ncbi:MAG TPA: ABC transporter permease, partial [Hanamia sp.]|nr:ABC transporter permease [Hanamia sp.]